MNSTIKLRSFLLALLVLATGLSGCVSTSNDLLIKNQLALSAEQKLKFDRVFFNEIDLWNQTSWRYGKPSGAKRQKEFEAMAEQGYLPAYVALKMFDFEEQTKSPDAAAFKLLREAADAGDVSSACALIPIWSWNNIDGYPRKFEWAREYIELGTRAGHFACQVQMAELYRKEIVHPPNTDEERRLLLLAAQAGYSYAFVVLEVSLKAIDKILVKNLDRSLCWEVANSLYTPWPAIYWDYYKAAAGGAYPQLGLTDEERAEVGRLAKKWKSRMATANGSMDIVNECLILEGGVK
jgi:hypothetical protein